MRDLPTSAQLIRLVERRGRGMDRLAAVELAGQVRDDLAAVADLVLEHFVGDAREAGLSWTAIGERLGVSKQAARQRFLEASALESSAHDLEIRPRLLACVDQARVAAGRDGSAEVGSQHLLLGLLHTGVAATVLDDLGVTRQRVRDSIGRLFEPTNRGEGGAEPELGEEAAQALASARRFARERGSCYVGTEHLLCVLALDPGSPVRRVLNDLDVRSADVKRGLAETGCLPRSRRRSRHVTRTAR